MRNILLILGYLGLLCMYMCATLRASLSGTFPQRMDVVNQCLEFACLCVCVCGGRGWGGGDREGPGRIYVWRGRGCIDMGLAVKV